MSTDLAKQGRGGKRDRKNKGNNDDVRWSHALARLLRHRIKEEGLTMTSDGYVQVKDVLSLQQFNGCTMDKIQHIVDNNDKQRFSMKSSGGQMYIRANQGHSIDVAKELKTEEMMSLITVPITPCIHGTYQKFLPSIQANGLNRMSRGHIHMTSGLEADVISGFRGNCNILLYIDMEAAMKDGIKFYLSDNKVILTEGVNGVLDYKYVKQAVERSNTFWKA